MAYSMYEEMTENLRDGYKSWLYEFKIFQMIYYRNEESTYEGLKPSLATEQTYSSLKQGNYLIWFIFS